MDENLNCVPRLSRQDYIDLLREQEMKLTLFKHNETIISLLGKFIKHNK
jgi:hypothetical protein